MIDWTDEDAEVLGRFMSVGTGAKLGAMLKREIAAQNELAVFAAELGADKGQYACGRARGYHSFYSRFQSLRAENRISAGAGADETSTNEADPFGEGNGLGHLSP